MKNKCRSNDVPPSSTLLSSSSNTISNTTTPSSTIESRYSIIKQRCLPHLFVPYDTPMLNLLWSLVMFKVLVFIMSPPALDSLAFYLSCPYFLVQDYFMFIGISSLSYLLLVQWSNNLLAFLQKIGLGLALIMTTMTLLIVAMDIFCVLSFGQRIKWTLTYNVLCRRDQFTSLLMSKGTLLSFVLGYQLIFCGLIGFVLYKCKVSRPLQIFLLP